MIKLTIRLFLYHLSGIVESTENIYKYHMQLQPNSTTSNGSCNARTPPQPLIQTKIVNPLPESQSHSRSSSHSSLQSAKTSLQSNTITTIATIQSPPNPVIEEFKT